MNTIEFYLDDKYQICFSVLKDLKYELIQADIRFGFENIDVSQTTVSEIDALLTSKMGCFDTNVKNGVSAILSADTTIDRFDLVLENERTKGIGFGFQGLAIIIDEKGIWLFVKEYNDFQLGIMTELIQGISIKYDLFINDNAQGIVVESKFKNNVKAYFEYED